MLALTRPAVVAGILWLLSAAALALTPANNSRVQHLDLTFDATSTGLSDAQKAAIDEQLAWVKGCSGWPELGDAIIYYRLAAASLPRQDYQRIGERIEDIRTYLMNKHGFPKVWAGVRIGEDEGEYPGVKNYRQPVESQVQMMLFCQR